MRVVDAILQPKWRINVICMVAAVDIMPLFTLKVHYFYDIETLHDHKLLDGRLIVFLNHRYNLKATKCLTEFFRCRFVFVFVIHVVVFCFSS